MGRIIERDRSIIPACDVRLDVFEDIVKSTGDIEGVGAYKVGFKLGLGHGLPKVVETARQHTDKPIIYDHQKAGTDIPDMGENFAEVCRNSGVNAVILFPEAGPVTQYEWTLAAQEQNLGVAVGGEMTHPRYMEGDLSEGKKKDYTEIFENLGIERTIEGFIREFAPEDMYELAARMGVTDFVVPGNKPDKIRHYKELIERCGVEEPAFYSPGLVEQGGEISEGAEAAGKRFHGIVGRGIYGAENKREAALELTSLL